MIGASDVKMVVISDTCTAQSGQSATYPAITFDDPEITAQVTSVTNNIQYAVPGNSMPGTYTAIYITVSVGQNATEAVKSVYVTNVGQDRGPSMKALLNVIPVTVQSYIKWQNTGIKITAGTPATVKYSSGLWTANPDDNQGQLYDAAGNPAYINAKPGYTMPNENEGALIGRIGSTVFLIGDGATVPSNLTGDLELCINDDLNGTYGAGFTDNESAVTVKVTVG